MEKRRDTDVCNSLMTSYINITIRIHSSVLPGVLLRPCTPAPLLIFFGYWKLYLGYRRTAKKYLPRNGLGSMPSLLARFIYHGFWYKCAKNYFKTAYYLLSGQITCLLEISLTPFLSEGESRTGFTHELRDRYPALPCVLLRHS